MRITGQRRKACPVMQVSDNAISSPKVFAGPPVQCLSVAAAEKERDKDADHTKHRPRGKCQN